MRSPIPLVALVGLCPVGRTGPVGGLLGRKEEEEDGRDYRLLVLSLFHFCHFYLSSLPLIPIGLDLTPLSRRLDL